MVNKAVIEVTATPKDTPPRYSILECKNQLMLDFRRIRLDEISKVLEFHNGHYAESYKCLRLVMEKMDNQLQNGGKIQASHSVDVRLILKEDTKPSVTIKFKKRPWDRLCCNICIYSEDLRQEVIKIGKEMKILDKCKQRVAFHGLLTMNPNHRLRANRQFALSLVQEEYSKMGQLIECACCFGQCAFDNMAQCSDGHLVCVECLQSYINELLFGTGKVSLTCMMPDCAAEYPQSELARCLDSNVLSKLEERIVLENLNTAKKEDIVRYNTMANEAVIEVTTTQKDTPPPYGFLECKNQLMLDFRRVRLDEISKVLEFHNGHYAESYKCLRLVMEKMDNQLQNGGNIQTSDSDGVSLILKEETKPSVTIKFEKRPWDRLCCNICVYSEDLRQEVIKVKEEMKILDERANRQFALSLVQEEYSKMGQLIECACCFGQCAFDNMAQCSDGHLVCVECLQSYINELLFGTGKVSVTCMTSECDAEYPQSIPS